MRRGMQHRSQGNQAAVRMIALLESIDRRLQVAIRARQDAGTAPIALDQAYTRTQAARLLSVSTWAIDRARKQGLLIEARRIGQRDVRITGESLLTFMKNRRVASVRVRRM